jgi:hypothetical protein
MNRIILANRARLARLDKEIIIPQRAGGFKGRYKLDAMRPDGRIRPLTGWFDNLITDYGLNWLGTGSSNFSYCCVGSGNTAPANGDTTLVSQVASGATQIASTSAIQPSPPYFGTLTNVYQFGQGVAAGNLAEVGVGPNPGGGQLFSRALILDSGGSPTTITVLSDEFLNVTYQCQYYPHTADVTGTIVIAGTTYNYTARVGQVTSYNWTPYRYGDTFVINQMNCWSGFVGPVTGTPLGSQSAPNSESNAAYSSGSLTAVHTGTWSLTQGNFALPGGVQAFSYILGNGASSGGYYQVGIQDGSGNGIPKDSSSVMTFTVQASWGRGT